MGRINEKINNGITWTLLLIVIGLFFLGYFNSVYVIHTHCGDHLAIEKINKPTYKAYLTALKNTTQNYEFVNEDTKKWATQIQK